MLFVIYLGKVETKLPAALIAIVVGSAVAWISGVMGLGAVQESLSSLNFYIPHPTLGIFDGAVVSSMVPFLPIIIVFSLNEVITGIQAVEQAKECGDTFFTNTKPLVPVSYTHLPVVLLFMIIFILVILVKYYS